MAKKELKPEEIHQKGFTLKKEYLKELTKNIDKFDFEVEENKSDTFYKLAIEKLFDNNNIETKTEFLNPAEVFSATKLQFLGNYADIPFLADFISGLEKKRISLHRKGREEIVLSLQERRHEEQELRQQALLNGGRLM